MKITHKNKIYYKKIKIKKILKIRQNQNLIKLLMKMKTKMKAKMKAKMKTKMKTKVKTKIKKTMVKIISMQSLLIVQMMQFLIVANIVREFLQKHFLSLIISINNNIKFQK